MKDFFDRARHHDDPFDLNECWIGIKGHNMGH
jgi:hypothetical protein